jgi:hypothetical protein
MEPNLNSFIATLEFLQRLSSSIFSCPLIRNIYSNCCFSSSRFFSFAEFHIRIAHVIKSIEHANAKTNDKLLIQSPIENKFWIVYIFWHIWMYKRRRRWTIITFLVIENNLLKIKILFFLKTKFSIFKSIITCLNDQIINLSYLSFLIIWKRRN